MAPKVNLRWGAGSRISKSKLQSKRDRALIEQGALGYYYNPRTKTWELRDTLFAKDPNARGE
jgi:hypothetical protein